MKIKKKRRDKDELKTMSLVEHLTDLRKCVIVAVVSFILATLISFHYSDFFISQMTSIANDYNFVYISPSELLMQYIKVTLIVSLVATSPIILYQLWSFACPGLRRKEKVVLFFSFLGGLIFFFAGGAFSFYIVTPTMLQFFVNFEAVEVVRPMITIANYIGFILNNIVIFGIIFEMPILTIALTQLGLLKPEWLTKSRSIVIITIFVLAALITPPDVISQVMVAVPMLILYEASVLISKILSMKKRKKCQ